MKRNRTKIVAMLIALTIALLLSGCEITVEPLPEDNTTSLPWAGSTPKDVLWLDWHFGEITENTKTLWYKYDGNKGTAYYFHYFDAANFAGFVDVMVSVYEPDGTLKGSFTGHTTNPLTPENADGILYFKFESAEYGKYGGFFFQVRDMDFPMTKGTIDFSGGNSADILEGEIHVWQHTIGTAANIQFQWEALSTIYNADSSKDHTAVVYVSAFQAGQPVFYRDQLLGSAGEHTQYCNAGAVVYMIVEGLTSGSYYVDLDS